MRNPIIAALDVPTVDEALPLAEQIAPFVGAFKVGSQLFTNSGPELIKRLRKQGATVFLDLKFHDIPNTVSKAVAAAARLDIQMLTVHAAGGLEMMEAAQESARRTAREAGHETPLVLGVTVLTSMDDRALGQIGVETHVQKQVDRLARLAMAAGLRGLVCSPLEIAQLRRILPAGIQLVTPGIRVAQEKADDQRRTLGAKEALQAGADWLVIGRPIYGAPDPRGAAESILASLT